MNHRINWNRIAEVMLAHHPICGPYRGDVFILGGVRWCIGCLVTYSTAFAAFLTLAMWRPGVEWWQVGALGVSLGLMQLVSTVGWATTKGSKILTKTLLGLGIALVTYAVLLAPWTWPIRIGVLALGATVAGLTTITKAPRMLRTCDECMFHRQWDICPGMSIVRPQ